MKPMANPVSIPAEDMLSSIDLENSDELKPAGQVIISMFRAYYYIWALD